VWQSHQMRGIKNHETSQVWTMHYVWAYSVMYNCGVQYVIVVQLYIHFHPRSANFDFEIAGINALRSTFPSVAINLRMQVPLRSGTVAQHTALRSHRWLQIWKWSRPLATFVLYGLSFLQPNDVSDAFVFDCLAHPHQINVTSFRMTSVLLI